MECVSLYRTTRYRDGLIAGDHSGRVRGSSSSEENIARLQERPEHQLLSIVSQ